MGLFDIFKRKKNMDANNEGNIETVVLEYIDYYTKLTIYYECKINIDNSTVTAKILDSRPQKEEIYDFDNYIRNSTFLHQINNSIGECGYTLKRRWLNDDRYFAMDDLYNLKDIENNIRVKKAYKKYNDLKNILQLKCHNENISLVNNENQIYNFIIDEIKEKSRVFGRNHGFESELNIDFCRSNEGIKNELNNQLNREFNSSELGYAGKYLIQYYSSYIECLPFLLEILNKRKINDNEKLVIKKYTELFSILPFFINKIDYLKSCEDEILISKAESNKKRLEQNQMFVDSLLTLFEKCDTNNSDLYLHTTIDEDSAKSIMEKGLYVFSDNMYSFSVPCTDFSQVLNYHYDSESLRHSVNDCIVVFQMPKNDIDLLDLSEEEKEAAKHFINLRRSDFITIKPSKKVDSSNILGVIDKRKMVVLYNDNFNKNKYNSRIGKY